MRNRPRPWDDGGGAGCSCLGKGKEMAGLLYTRGWRLVLVLFYGKGVAWGGVIVINKIINFSRVGLAAVKCARSLTPRGPAGTPA